MSADNDYFDEEYVTTEPEEKRESAEEQELRELEKVTINMRYNWLRTVAAIVAVLLVAGAALWVWMIFWVPVVSEQQQMGYVSEVRCEGRVFKTFEGKMLTFGFVRDTIREPVSEFIFSVESDSIARGLMLLQKTGKRVALTYKTYETTLPWRGSTPRIVVAFEERQVEAVAVTDEDGAAKKAPGKNAAGGKNKKSKKK